MKNKDAIEKDALEIVADFGEDFGVLVKQDIGQMFVDIHASFSALDPIMLKAVEQVC